MLEPPSSLYKFLSQRGEKMFYKSRNTAGRDKWREGVVQMSRWSRQIAFTGTELRLEEEIKH